MTDEKKKELFFYLFRKVWKRSFYDDPYDFLFAIIDPILQCKDCPLRDKDCRVRYKNIRCVDALEEALQEGDIQL